MSENVRRAKAALFLSGLAVYYVIYYVRFAEKVAAYFQDVLRHFPWVREFLGMP